MSAKTKLFLNLLCVQRSWPPRKGQRGLCSHQWTLSSRSQQSQHSSWASRLLGTPWYRIWLFVCRLELRLEVANFWKKNKQKKTKINTSHWWRVCVFKKKNKIELYKQERIYSRLNIVFVFVWLLWNLKTQRTNLEWETVKHTTTYLVALSDHYIHEWQVHMSLATL